MTESGRGALPRRERSAAAVGGSFKVRGREIFRSINTQLALLFLALAVVILVTDTFIAGKILGMQEQQVYTAVRNELSLYVQTLDNDFDEVEDDLNGAIYRHLSAFLASESPQMERYRLWTEVRDLAQDHDRISLVYYRHGDEAEAVDLGYSSTDYTYRGSQRIKEEISGWEEAGASRAPAYVTLDGTGYILYRAGNYRGTQEIGILVRLDTILDQESGADAQGTVWFAADDHTLVGSGGTYSGALPEKLTEGITPLGDEVLIYVPGDVGTGLCCIIERREVVSGLLPLQVGTAGLVVLVVALVLFIWFVIRRSVGMPLERLNDAMKEIQNNHMDYRMSRKEKSGEFEFVRQEFNEMASEITKLRIETYEKEIEKLQIEETNLRLQVSPHMLQNSLNMIYNLSLSGNNRVIQKFVLCLSDYFRYSLQKHGEVVTLKEEMKFVESYLGVQKVRFPGKFVYVYDIADDLMDRTIPPLLIQNFVENTIKYSLKTDGEIEIIIEAAMQEDRLRISIVDTGVGMSPESLARIRKGEAYTDENGKHIGIWNSRRRLRMIYGEEAVLDITSSPGEGTQVYIEIPEGRENRQSGEDGQSGQNGSDEEMRGEEGTDETAPGR